MVNWKHIPCIKATDLQNKSTKEFPFLEQMFLYGWRYISSDMCSYCTVELSTYHVCDICIHVQTLILEADIQL